MNVTSEAVSASCSFTDCPESMVSRVVLALVDQLCTAAGNDIDITLLDALDYPLGVSLAALHPYGIIGADVDVAGGELSVRINLSQQVTAPAQLVHDADDIVGSFFDVTSTPVAACVHLVGSLG